jgi:hypothetical protein
MIDYKDLKELAEEHKPKIIYSGFLVLMFLIGFGSGNAWGPDQKNNKQNESLAKYNSSKPQNKEVSKEADMPAKTTGDTTPATESKNTEPKTCTKIKGNISSKSKIYHVPGGAFYDRTQEEMCFENEAEAQAAGFKKSSR